MNRWMIRLWMLAAILLAGSVLHSSLAWAQEGAGAAEEAATAESTTGELGTSTSDSDEKKAGTLAEQWDLFITKWQQGGATMYVIAFVALVGLVFAVDRLIGLTRGKIAPHGLADKANKLWEAGDYEGVIKAARQSNSSLGRVIAFLVEHREAPFDLLNHAAEDLAAREFDVHERRNYVLTAVGTISPLLGLMGTIFGLIDAFASIGTIGTMDKPSVLADDIGKAMVTTAGGLIVAVPALGLYHFFRSRTGQLASILSEETSNLMHAWFLKKGAR